MSDSVPSAGPLPRHGAGTMRYEAMVMGASAGGLEALQTILSALPTHFAIPVLIVQHLSPQSENLLAEVLNRQCRIVVQEAEEKETPRAGMAYIAPPDYHLMVEADRTLSLSREERVNFSRPSIDVLFETAAEAYGDKLIGVVLTGANADGSQGLRVIKKFGGTCVVQDPRTAVAARMPQAAIESTRVDYVVPLVEIAPLIVGLLEGKHG